MEIDEELRKNGVLVVTEHTITGTSVAGVAASLDGAMRIVLKVGHFTRLIPCEDGDGYTAERVDEHSVEAVQDFKWVDENAWPGRPSRFAMGTGMLTAYFQDEGSAFRVVWTEFQS